MNITSPLTGVNNVRKIKTIETSRIINSWLKFFKLDVSRFFSGLSEIFVYECGDTGYRFYYPFNLEGDSDFYAELQKQPWYYMENKWEYSVACSLIKPEENVLEIGCGNGFFLKKLSQSNHNCYGLELNRKAIGICQSKNLKVIGETVEAHALANSEKYDIVASFQTMEHIAQIGQALRACLKLLKSGGRLIMSVPNNSSFIGKDEYNCFNLPPHHMGLWNEKSIKNLEKFFGLKLKKTYLEPLQSYNHSAYYHIMIGRFIKKLGPKAEPLYKLSRRLVLHYLAKPYPKKIKGHTIMAVYEKI